MPSWKKVIVSGSSPTLNELTLSGDINLAPTNKIQFDGDGGHTYIDEQSDDNLRFRVGAQNMMIMVEGDTDYVRVPDSVRLSVGSSNDLQMVHDGTNSFILNNTNDLTISNLADDKDIILKSDNGSGGTTAYITLDGSATQTLLHQDTVLTGGKKLYIAGNTYITEASSDVLDFYVGGVKMYTIDETNNLITMRGTGGSDGAAGSPTLRLSNTVESGDWDTGDVVGALEYYAEDTSGNAPYVASFIKSVNPQGNGTLPGGYLSFGTSPYNQSGGATEEFRMETDGDFHAVGDIVAYSSTPSDKRLKDNVVTIDNSLDLVSQLRGVRFDWNIGSKEGQQDIGVIAQEVEQIIPEIVSEKKLPLLTGNDETIYKVVDYEKLTAVLIESIKELKQEVDEIKQKCDCLNK